jgi:hypothetical protein
MSVQRVEHLVTEAVFGGAINEGNDGSEFPLSLRFVLSGRHPDPAPIALPMKAAITNNQTGRQRYRKISPKRAVLAGPPIGNPEFNLGAHLILRSGPVIWGLVG